MHSCRCKAWPTAGTGMVEANAGVPPCLLLSHLWAAQRNPTVVLAAAQAAAAQASRRAHRLARLAVLSKSACRHERALLEQARAPAARA